MTGEATFKILRCFAVVLSTTAPGFSRNNIYQIWAISVSVFVDFDAVSIHLLPLIEDVMVDSHEIWRHVKHLLAWHMEILKNLLLIMLFERRQDFEVRTELEIDGALEFGELKWRAESSSK